MFIPRSARRIRIARTAFVLGAILPCAALVAWAVHRHSAAHRDTLRARWEQAVGLPITVTTVEHPLPGVVRARGCTLATADGRPALELAGVDVETSPTEVRLGIAALACDPAGAGVLAGLAEEWLLRGARFRRDVVIDVADLAWELRGADGRTERFAVGPVRIECVAQGDDRAVRIVRRAAEPGDDEVRLVRSARDGETAAAGERLDIEASITTPLPYAVVAAVVGSGPVAALPVGPSATVTGRLTGSRALGRWAGTARGLLAGVDLAACTATLPAGAVGTMEVDVRSIEWRDGRLAAGDVACSAAAGRVDRRLLDALVSTVGCRAGAAYAGGIGDREAAFDALGCAVRISGRGVELEGDGRLGGAVVVAAGRPLLDPPRGVVPVERLAWLLAPPGAVYVPSSGAGAWLMSILPPAGAALDRTSQAGGEPAADGF
jgi:hypothetical protein